MGEQTENLKQVAQIRKAIQPLIEMIKVAPNEETNKRLEILESTLQELLKRDYTVEVKSPDVEVNVDTEKLVKAIEKLDSLQKPVTTPTAYEPHDQVKKGTFQYSGFVRSDGQWYIQRVAKGEQRYAKGVGDYTKAWEKKSDLKYGYLDGS